jgi:protoporphyrinogen IX oxidase
MPWMVALHIAAMGAWFSSLMAVPLVLAAQLGQKPDEDRDVLLGIALRLFTHGATVTGLITIATGVWLIFSEGFDGGWLPLKLAFVSLLVVLHLYWGKLLAAVRDGYFDRGIGYLQGMSLAPLGAALPVIVLVTAKPF